jgi:flagellar biosynthesis protein FliQ
MVVVVVVIAVIAVVVAVVLATHQIDDSTASREWHRELVSQS